MVLGTFRAALPREVKAAGASTLQALLLGSALVLAVTFLALLAAIEGFVVSRLRRINADVDRVGTAGQESAGPEAIAPQGRDEIGVLASSLGHMLGTIDEKNAAMRDIVSNVSSGFLMVDAGGVILPGHTDYCLKLLGKKKIAGQVLAGVLYGEGASFKRDRDSFALLLEQVFEDILPEDVALSQMPQEVLLGERWVALTASTVRNKDGSIRAVLFTLSDVTALKASERKVADIMALMQCLQAREVFASLVGELPEMLDRLRLYVSVEDSGAATATSQDNKARDARKLLHTLKGNFAMFGLGEIARLIHSIEDSPVLVVEHIDAIEVAVRAYLEEYSALLGLTYGEARVQQYSVSDAELAALTQVAERQAASSQELRTAIMSFAHRTKLMKVDELLAPIARAGNQLAERLGKQAVVEVVPSKLLVDYAQFHSLFDALINAVRNAVDHGLESPGERGDKPTQGRVQIRAGRDAEALLIEIADDGRGVKFERMEFLFTGRVSTAAQVNDFLGAGAWAFGLALPGAQPRRRCYPDEQSRTRHDPPVPHSLAADNPPVGGLTLLHGVGTMRQWHLLA